MAIDLKYGKVTLENSSIGEDEPVVVFRARDQLIIDVLRFYKLICHWAGSSKTHIDLIDEALIRISKWQSTNSTQIPTSKHYSK